MKNNTKIVLKNDSPEDLKTALDCAVRDYNKKMAKRYDKGYKMKDGRQYNNYMSNKDWESYLAKMKEDHKGRYEMGAGGELKAGKNPPKMASFGSSSRFIYELSKGIEGFIFEERLDTRVGGTANLDGFLPKGNDYIYVEAKMREIYYPSHEGQEIKAVYEPVYEAIKRNLSCSQFDFEPKESIKKNGDVKKGLKKITFKINNEPVKYFDLKQLICHFLGITYDIAKHSVKNAKVIFLYLLYSPEDVEDMIENKYRKELMDRYGEVKRFIEEKKDVLKSIFYAVLQYQTDTHKLEKPDIDFDFKLVDQDDYIKELKR